MWVRWAEQQKERWRRNWFIWTFVFCCKFDDVTIRLVHWGEESRRANCYNYAVPGANPLSIWWPVLSNNNHPSHSLASKIISLNLYLIYIHWQKLILCSDWIIHLTATIKRNWFPQAIYLMHFIVHLNTVTFASFVLQFWHFRYIMTQ